LTATGTSGLTTSNNNASIYQNLFPSARFESVGAPGRNWVEVELRQRNNVLLWILDGTVAAQRTNTSVFTSGNVMVGFMDPFSSIASPAEDAVALFANLRVEDLSLPALQPPSIKSQPASQAISTGANVTFIVGATGSNLLGYQWRFNGTDLVGASNSSFSLTNVQPANTGSYDVLVGNAAGLVASAPATLSVTLPDVRFLSAMVLSNDHVQLLFSGVPGQVYVVQASTNLVDWLPVSVLTATNGPLVFTYADTTNFPCRFYRAYQSASQMLTDFEAYAPGTQVMFQPPSASGSTAGFLNLTPDFAYVTNSLPAGHSSAKVLVAGWNFKAGTTNPWLRLTTFSAANLPNPTLGTNQVVQFDIYTDNTPVCCGRFPRNRHHRRDWR